MSEMIKYQEQKQELEYFNHLAMIAAKGGGLKESPEVIINIMLTAKDFGISPMKAINSGFQVIKGKICMTTNLMADRIRKAGHSIRIPEWTSEKCIILGVRKDNGDSIKFEYTIEDAKLAGLTSNPNWSKFPKNMLYCRAMSTLARTLFPDVVGNAYSEDEQYDIMNIPPEKRPIQDPDSMTLEIMSSPVSEENKMDRLKRLLTSEEMPITNLEEYLNDICSKQGKSIEQIIDAATNPNLFSKFKSSYAKFLAKKIEDVSTVSA